MVIRCYFHVTGEFFTGTVQCNKSITDSVIYRHLIYNHDCIKLWSKRFNKYVLFKYHIK